MPRTFQIKSDFKPSGDQPKAIDKLIKGINDGLSYQTLLGVTGSGKTFTMANVIAHFNRPALILAHNKTLAAQLYGEFKSFFPKNRVEYFVSYYDYYQPEAYVPSTNTYIEKDASINSHIEQMRLSATKAIIESSDTIIVATVSSIYGLGAPEAYLNMILHLSIGEVTDEKNIIHRLIEMQYSRNNTHIERGQFRARGDIIDIFPAESDMEAFRIELFDGKVDSLVLFDPLTGKNLSSVSRITIYPKTHFVTPKDRIDKCINSIKLELSERLRELKENNKLVEAQRLEEKVKYDIEMMVETGYCSGIENYSRYLSGRDAGMPPPTLFDYLPYNTILFIDESHVTIPQIGAMFKGDRSRKENLVKYGFRLPSALDNRPLQFHEWERLAPQMIMVSATPSDYEREHCDEFAELVVRPTGVIDPEIEVRPAKTQIDDLLDVIWKCKKTNHRILVTTLTKRLSEELTDFLSEHGIKVGYLHSDIDTVERVEIIKDLRVGTIDVLVGINLLREGLDMPEVGLVAILDADKEGFLRSERSLIQTIGRAARNTEGKAILYADKITKSMQKAIDETNRRREKQKQFNKENNIIPISVKRSITDILETGAYIEKATGKKSKKSEKNIFLDESIDKWEKLSISAKISKIDELEKKMRHAADELDFERAAIIRDSLRKLKETFMLD